MDNDLQLASLYENIKPMGNKRVAVVIGRFNPPTKGHYAVVDKVKKFIRTHKHLKLELSPVVIVIGGSKSDLDKKKNPLSVDERILFMKSSGHANGATFLTASNAFEALSMLRNNGLEPIAIAAGTDRIDDYVRILDKHFLTPDGKQIKHEKIHLERDADAIITNKDEKQVALDSALSKLKTRGTVDTDIVSGSLARRAVELGYKEEFAKIVGLDDKPILASKMFNKIKHSLGE